VGTLYLVATPIGNLDDISQRALRILREVQLIAAEDTRHTGKLLAHFGIHAKLTSYYEHNELKKLDEILSRLAAGDVALVSNAGTPLINDPGYVLVKAVLDAGFDVSPIPGPCAPIAALIASGLPSDSFLYLGYLPRKRGDRYALLNNVARMPYTLIFLETPHRLLDALGDLIEILGDRRVGIARELTKLHEQIFRGTLSEARQYFMEKPPRGEFTLIVSGHEKTPKRWSEERLKGELIRRLQDNEQLAQIAAYVARESGWPRREVYQLLLNIQDQIE